MTKTEIERAYIVNNIDAFRDRLKVAGFILAKKEEQLNHYYEHPFFPDMIDQKRYLRVRHLRGNLAPFEITFSSPVIDPATGTEVRKQFIASAPNGGDKTTIMHVLESIGFAKALELRKNREYYTMTGSPDIDETSTHIELDFLITFTIDDARMFRERLELRGDAIILADTAQICIEHHGDGTPDITAIEAEFDRVAASIGIDPKTAIGENYFERYKKSLPR